MGEIPEHIPSIDSLVQASAVRPHQAVETVLQERGCFVHPALVDEIMQLMTPQEVLDRLEHEREVISPQRYGTFDALLHERRRIRDLELVPIRDQQSYTKYMNMPRERFIELVKTHYVGSSKLSLVSELFPSNLSADVDQRVIWIRDTNIDNREVAQFIAAVMLVYELTLDDVIFFERSRVSNTEFVRAAVPEYRHIHLWMRKKSS